MGDLIGQFTKNATEEVRISLTEYRGHKLIDMRVYYEPREGGDRLPSKKGLTLAVDLYPELKKTMLELERILLKEKLLDKEDLEKALAGGDGEGQQEEAPEQDAPEQEAAEAETDPSS